MDQRQPGKVVRQAELISDLPESDWYKQLTVPYLTLAGQIFTLGTVNRILGTAYTLDTIAAVPNEVIEACLALDAMRHDTTR